MDESEPTAGPKRGFGVVAVPQPQLLDVMWCSAVVVVVCVME